MWAQLPEGRSRIEVARDVLDDFLRARQRAAPARRTAVPCPDGGTGCEAFQTTAFGRVIADVVADDKGRPRSVRLSGGREFRLSYGDFGIMPPPWSVR